MKKRENNNIKKFKTMKVKQANYKPFVLVTDNNQEGKEVVRIAVGNQIASPLEFETEEEANAYLQNEPYEMFINLYTILRYYENEDKIQNQKNMAKSKKTNV